MEEELLPFDIKKEKTNIIKVLGVGGGGGNAVNHMFNQGIKDVDFMICNTDEQALRNSPIPVKIRLGDSLTSGRGAGNKPGIGKDAAVENVNDVKQALEQNTKMIFITAGMGGGTGTGAAPIIAEAARELGILTVGIVTIPFKFEGERRIQQAIEGISELTKYVDSLLVIHNEKLREVYGNLPLRDAFSRADDVLTVAAKGIAEIITVHGYVNVDFADVETVMKDSGVALMGSGTASGEGRAQEAIETALNSPLLNNNNILGAKNILLNIISGENEVTMDEITEINEFVQEATGFTADLIWGSSKDETLGDSISVTLIATGFDTDVIPEVYSFQQGRNKVVLEVKDSTKKTGQTTNVTPQENMSEKVSTRITNDNEPDDFFVVQGKDKEKEVAIKAEHTEQESIVETELEMDDYQLIVKTKDPDAESIIEDDIDDSAKIHIDRLRKIREKAVERSRRKEHLKKPLDELTIEELENNPSFKRKGEDIPDINYSSASKVSKISLRETDKGTELSNSNSYLHDNVD